MNVSKFTSSLLSISSLLAIATTSFAEVAEDILAAASPFKASVSFANSYSEAIVTTRDEGEVSREVVAKPEKVAAKVVANLQGFDFESEIDDSTAVEITVGGFQFAATLGESKEAERAGEFPVRGKKATFPIIGFIPTDSGDDRVKRAGSIVFSWTATKLTVKVTVTDVALVGLTGIGALDLVGLYSDESENGTRPSGSVRFSGEPIEVAVGFGSAVGGRTAFAKGSSSTKVKRFGRGDEAEEFLLESVKLTGSLRE